MSSNVHICSVIINATVLLVWKSDLSMSSSSSERKVEPFTLTNNTW